jgi:hypothetical protein
MNPPAVPPIRMAMKASTRAPTEGSAVRVVGVEVADGIGEDSGIATIVRAIGWSRAPRGRVRLLQLGA